MSSRNKVHKPFDGPSDLGLSRVLVVHNAYRQRGGEDAVVESEINLLRKHGHAVHTYDRHNDELHDRALVGVALDAVWSRRTFREIGKLISDFEPDVVHAHNTFPLISPSLYWAAAKAGVPVVQTLHNFRLLCPQALMLRDNKVCEDCLGHVPWRAVVHRCYRQSAPQSAVVAATVQLHRAAGTWRHKVARYIALNEFCRDKFIAGGLPAERISVKPNFVDLAQPAPQSRDAFLFVGRMAVEKGIETLAAAMRARPGSCRLRAVGDGPLVHHLHGLPQVDALGPCPPSQVIEEMARTRALVVPSICYENHPRTVVEAFACGTPVIASRIGALATLVEDGTTGLLFRPGDPADLVRCLEWAQAHPDAMADMGRQARRVYERDLTGEVNHALLIEIYRQATGRPC